MSDVNHNPISLDYSVSYSKGSADFIIDHSCPMEIKANINHHTSCTINHELKQ